jgi:hypothetical protein
VSTENKTNSEAMTLQTNLLVHSHRPLVRGRSHLLDWCASDDDEGSHLDRGDEGGVPDKERTPPGSSNNNITTSNRVVPVVAKPPCQSWWDDDSERDDPQQQRQPGEDGEEEFEFTFLTEEFVRKRLFSEGSMGTASMSTNSSSSLPEQGQERKHQHPLVTFCFKSSTVIEYEVVSPEHHRDLFYSDDELQCFRDDYAQELQQLQQQQQQPVIQV